MWKCGNLEFPHFHISTFPNPMDLYSLLGLAPGASPADIKRAYRRLARRYHPGINPGDRAAESLYGRISEAYETLADPDRRRAYDAAGGAGPPGGGGGRAGARGGGFLLAPALPGGRP